MSAHLSFCIQVSVDMHVQFSYSFSIIYIYACIYADIVHIRLVYTFTGSYRYIVAFFMQEIKMGSL